MTTVPQNPELIKHLIAILRDYRCIFRQQRVYARAMALVLGELLVFSRHTITQVLMGLGMNGQDWSAWYRLFSRQRFNYEAASEVLFRQSLAHVSAEEVYVVAGDATQTPRSSGRMEGVGWLRNLRTPPFKVGIHRAQQWFHGSWLVPAEQGYSRALPLRWVPAFTAKSKRTVTAVCKEWEAALAFLVWLKAHFTVSGRPGQRLLFVGDGHYDTVPLWQALPAGVILLARSAKNRVVYHLPQPTTGRGRHRKYGDRALSPQQVWQERRGWQRLELTVRGRVRHLQVKVRGPFLRRGAPDCPLMLIVVRGKDNPHTRRDPLPFLVNASLSPEGKWCLPLPLTTLLFWAWQRWELEVAHRELKATFGLGHKQCWNPHAAVLSVQWSAWVYAVLLLAGYRTWGLSHGPQVPTRWWSGSGRWSFNTLWRAYRANFWHAHEFCPLLSLLPNDWLENDALLPALRHAAFASAPA
ncbi:MAG TPA: hypothetical protein VHP83_14655 [Aggregatilineaceae bacterium]|nr:hypothetical protein [Aggregatilineaceae bacterium]